MARISASDLCSSRRHGPQVATSHKPAWQASHMQRTMEHPINHTSNPPDNKLQGGFGSKWVDESGSTSHCGKFRCESSRPSSRNQQSKRGQQNKNWHNTGPRACRSTGCNAHTWTSDDHTASQKPVVQIRAAPLQIPFTKMKILYSGQARDNCFYTLTSDQSDEIIRSHQCKGRGWDSMVCWNRLELLPSACAK